jgi:hypothetical protein
MDREAAKEKRTVTQKLAENGNNSFIAHTNGDEFAETLAQIRKRQKCKLYGYCDFARTLSAHVLTDAVF